MCTINNYASAIMLNTVFFFTRMARVAFLLLFLLLLYYSIANGLDKQRRILDSLSGLFFTMNLLTILKTLFVYIADTDNVETDRLFISFATLLIIE